MKVTLYKVHPHGHQPALEIIDADKDFHEFIMRTVFSNRTFDKWYVRKNQLKVNPFFQGGSVFNSDDPWIFIEFWTKDFDNVFQFFMEVMQAWNKYNDSEVKIDYFIS